MVSELYLKPSEFCEVKYFILHITPTFATERRTEESVDTIVKSILRLDKDIEHRS